jgi:hypothetical protein
MRENPNITVLVGGSDLGGRAGREKLIYSKLLPTGCDYPRMADILRDETRWSRPRNTSTQSKKRRDVSRIFEAFSRRPLTYHTGVPSKKLNQMIFVSSILQEACLTSACRLSTIPISRSIVSLTNVSTSHRDRRKLPYQHHPECLQPPTPPPTSN